MFAEVRQVILEYLFEELEDLLDLGVIETEKRHYRILSDHIAESYIGLMFIHV